MAVRIFLFSSLLVVPEGRPSSSLSLSLCLSLFLYLASGSTLFGIGGGQCVCTTSVFPRALRSQRFNNSTKEPALLTAVFTVAVAVAVVY